MKSMLEILLMKDVGCTNLDDLYDLLSCDKDTHKFPVPLLSMNSKDDPICPYVAIPVDKIEQSPNWFHVSVAGGGHTEFYTGINPKLVRRKKTKRRLILC